MGLTDSGWVTPSLDEIVADIATVLTGKPGWGSATTDETSLTGQLIRAIADRVQDLYSLTGQVYSALDPNSATGTQLDRLLALAGLTRQAGESDAEFRQRFSRLAGATGAGSVSAISARLKDAVSAISDVAVWHNPRDYAQDGMGPHQLWVVVTPTLTGSDLSDFEAALWGDAGLPAGIDMAGDESATYYDSTHEVSATIHWDWADDIRIYVRVDITSSTDALPADADSRVKSVVVDAISGTHIGVDVLPDALSAAIIDQVPGIRSMDVYVSRTGPATTSDTDPVEIAFDEIATCATVDVEVNA